VAGLMSLALAACASAPVAARGFAWRRRGGSGVEDGRQALSLRWLDARQGFRLQRARQYSFRQAGVALPRDTEQQLRASASIRVSSCGAETWCL